MKQEHHLPLDASLAEFPAPDGKPFVTLLRHGSLAVELYAPKGKDLQTPHSRDELYVVARGSGIFLNGNKKHAFQAGDVLFVPAGVAHRFESFTDDFATWVMFYGAENGEPEILPITIRYATETEWYAVEKIRTEVFIKEQACTPEEEWDEYEKSSQHILGFVLDQPVACARWRSYVFQGKSVAKLERFAILKDHRGFGYGKTLVQHTILEAEKAGFSQQMIHAQAHLKAFYNDLGFVQASEPFDEAGIPHIKMLRG